MTVVSDVRDGVRIIRLARPERRNALVPALLTELVEALDAAAQHRQPIVLTGSDGAFCAGADLKWLGTCGNPAQGVAELVAMHHAAILRLLDARVPTVSAIDGVVAGGGLGLALAPDYRIASDRATFTAAYFRLGLTPDGGSSVFLERTIGATRAMELLLTNRKLSAREALEWGMVNEVVSEAAVLDHAVAFARTLPSIPPYTLLKTRQLFDMAQIRHQLQLESVAIRTASRGEAFRRALQAFVEAHPG